MQLPTKHVPAVEVNPLAGLANNVGSTRAVCQAAISTGLSELVLISTDKAVRPTNVMGASKRLAELVVQASALELSQSAKAAGQHPRTRLAMVRFSAMCWDPLVRWFLYSVDKLLPVDQITLTHPDIIRYFMTIPEAAQLVLGRPLLQRAVIYFSWTWANPCASKIWRSRWCASVAFPCGMLVTPTVRSQ